MRDGVTGIPTASLHAQAQQILTELTDALNAQIVRQSAEFDAWFDDLKGKLGEDPATALQQQVDNLNAAVVGDAFQASGTPVSIAYAGTNRIASITAYGENAQGGTTEAPVALTGISSITVNDDVTELPIPRPLRRVGDVKDKCVTRQDYESAEKLVVTYNVGFVELDGTEDVVFDTYGNTQKRIRFDLDRNAIARYALKFSHGNPGDTPTVTGGISASFNRDVLNRLQIICSPDTWTALGVTDTATAKTWLAAQKAAGTPVQVAYQLATPEVYATDPLDIDNAAGPLTVMTGGEVEVRMTELVGTRSPEIVAKMDKATYDADGDGVVDEAEKVSNALILKNAAGEVVATFDGSEAAILQLTAALVGALGKTEKAADSSKLAGLAPVVDNPGPNNRNTWYFPFTGTNNRDGTRKYYAALYADNATTAGRASNLSMGLNGTDLWVYYS